MPLADNPTLITLALSALASTAIAIVLYRKRILHPAAFPSAESGQRDVWGIPAPVWFVGGAMTYLGASLAVNLAQHLPPRILGEADSLRAKVIPETLGYLGALVIAALILSLLAPRTTEKTGLRPRPLDIPLGAAALLLAAPFCILIALISQYTAERITHQPSPKIAHTSLDTILKSRDDPWCWLLVAVIVLLVPAVEELIYRVFLGSCLLNLTGRTWPAIILTSAIFAAVHISAVPPQALPVLFTLGLAMALAYERTRRLGVPITMHALFNAANIALAILQEK